LKVPYPDFDLLYMWRNKRGGKKYKNINAITKQTFDSTDSLISYNPNCLVNASIEDLKEDTAHECYHIWQFSRFPYVVRTIEPNVRKRAKYDIVASNMESRINFYNSSWIEKGAERFAEVYVDPSNQDM